jgi:hypothetical protein
MLKDFKPPNLNAPRYVGKSFNPLLGKGFLIELRKQHPKFKYWTDVSIRNIIKKSNELIWEKVIENRDGVELPESLGYLFIGTCNKKKNANPNYNQSVLYGKTITNRNWESDEYLAKIFYTNYETRFHFKFRELWTFKACRNFTRTVSTTYPKSWTKYIKVEPTLNISRLFRKERKKQEAIKYTNTLLKDYNEFAGI